MNSITVSHHHLGVNPFAAIDRADLAKSTSQQYKRQIELYLNTGRNLGDAAQLADYASGLKSSPKSFLKSAVKLWAKEVEHHAKANSTPETVAAVMATIHRLDALNDAIRIKATRGSKPHNWLSGSQVKHLREVITDDRDYLIVSLMLQAGLRRNEVVTLKYSDVQALGDLQVLSVLGKGSKLRTVPITAKFAAELRDWPGDGEIIFPLTGQSVMNLTRKYGKMIGLPGLSPHDLRRSFAQTALDNGVDIAKISKLLGHSSVNTTARYLDLDVQRLPTIGDFMAF